MFSAKNLFFSKIKCDPALYPVALANCIERPGFQFCSYLKEVYPNGCPKFRDCGCIVNGTCTQCPEDSNVEANLSISGSFYQFTSPCNPGLSQWKQGSANYYFQITTPNVIVISQTEQWYGRYKRKQIGDPRWLRFECSYSEGDKPYEQMKINSQPNYTYNYLPCGGGLDDRQSLPFPEHYDRYWVEVELTYSKPGLGTYQKTFTSRIMPFSEMWEIDFTVFWVP